MKKIQLFFAFACVAPALCGQKTKSISSDKFLELQNQISSKKSAVPAVNQSLVTPSLHDQSRQAMREVLQQMLAGLGNDENQVMPAPVAFQVSSFDPSQNNECEEVTPSSRPTIPSVLPELVAESKSKAKPRVLVGPGTEAEGFLIQSAAFGGSDRFFVGPKASGDENDPSMAA